MKLITLIISGVFLLFFILGLLAFPEAPIYYNGSYYQGKYGGLYDQAIYDAYIYWSRLVIALFSLTFIANVYEIVVSYDIKQNNK